MIFSLSPRQILKWLSCTSGFKKDIHVTLSGKSVKFRNIAHSIILTEVAIKGAQSYEPELSIFLKKCVPSYGRFIDGGANVGFLTAVAQVAANDSIKIVAVEPLPENVQALNCLKADNNMPFEIVQAAITGTSDKTIQLFVPINKKGGETIASVINRFDGGNKTFDSQTRTLMVDAIHLDHLVGSDSGGVLCKLDCEGAEYGILSQATSVLERDDVDFILEINIGDETKYDLFNLMTSAGYQGYLMTSAGLVRENRPLTLPPAENSKRTLWRNHFFTKKSLAEVEQISQKVYAGWI